MRKPVASTAKPKALAPIRYRIGSSATELPALGLGVAGHGQPLGRKELERLKALKLAHVRVDLALWDAGWLAQLKRATREARTLGAGLEIALFVSAAAASELAQFVKTARPAALPVVRYLIYQRDEVATSAPWLALARQYLGAQAVIYSGTNLFFTELNCNRPDADKLELLNGLCYSFNPQVHAFDNSSLVEAMAAQAETIRSYRVFAKRTPLAITAITLKPRFDLGSVGPEPMESRLSGDLRQMALLGAGWTLGSLKSVAQTGSVNSATYYETSGPRGVMGNKHINAPPWPDGVYPMYHVFADVAEFGGQVIASKSSEPLVVDGLVMRTGKRTRVLLANYSDQPRTVRLSELGVRASVKHLDETNVAVAMADPEKYRAQPGPTHKTHAGALDVELRPYGLACIDA